MKIRWGEKDKKIARWLGLILCIGLLEVGIVFLSFFLTIEKVEREWKEVVKEKDREIIELKCLPLFDDFGYTYKQLEILTARSSMCKIWEDLFPEEGKGHGSQEKSNGKV